MIDANKKRKSLDRALAEQRERIDARIAKIRRHKGKEFLRFCPKCRKSRIFHLEFYDSFGYLHLTCSFCKHQLESLPDGMS